MMFARTLGTILTLPFAVAAAMAAEQAAPHPAASMPALVREYEADASSIERFYDLSWSAARCDRIERLCRDWLKRLEAVDFNSLDVSGRVDWVLLRNELERSISGAARDRKRLAEIEPLSGFHGIVEDLELARWRGDPVKGAETAARVSELAKQVKRLREGVEKGSRDKAGAAKAEAEKGGAKKDAKAAPTNDPPAIAVEPVRALRAAQAVAGARAALKRWYEFYDGFQPDFSWWMKTPYEEAGKELDDYAKLLKEEIAGQKGKDDDPLVGDPVGREALAEAIRFEFLPYTAEELIAIGERELARGEREMKAAAREMGCGDDWRKALAKVKGDFVPPGEQDDLIASVAREAIEFTRRHEFATVPPLCEETWRMAMLSPDAIKTVPYAAYSGQEMQVAYAREDMKQDDKLMVMRGNNRHATRLTTPHELIPGHHLQIFQSARHQPYRRVFGTPFYVEGWALYCEMRLWDLGWARTPEDKFGMLFWRMNRAARIVVSLKFHLGKMTPDEMVAFMVDRVGHEKLGATSEVRRFIGNGFSPLYQAAYTLGGLQLKALHDEKVRPGGMTERRFNDAVLEANTMPIELLRMEMNGTAPEKGQQPSWRFAGHAKGERP